MQIFFVLFAFFAYETFVTKTVPFEHGIPSFILAGMSISGRNEFGLIHCLRGNFGVHEIQTTSIILELK